MFSFKEALKLLKLIKALRKTFSVNNRFAYTPTRFDNFVKSEQWNCYRETV